MPQPDTTPPREQRTPLARALRAAQAPRLAQLLRFGSVGAMAFVVDLGLFNLLRFGPGELLEAKPLTAKVISAAVATVVAWIGNRSWTFAETRTTRRVRELGIFTLVNLAGIGVALACLAFSHYVLGFTSPLADNIAANGVGLVLGTAVRFLGYRAFVFNGSGAVPPTGAVRTAADDAGLADGVAAVEDRPSPRITR